MERLILMRHGKAERHAASGGDFERALAESGRADAAVMGRVLAGLGLTPDLMLVSSARRTRETAERLGLVAVEQADFREQDFGAWTGRRHHELERELGPAAYREFWKAPASNRPPGGESFVDQIARASAGLALLPAGEAILVVHSGTIRAVLAIALDLAPEQALRFVIDPLSLTRVDRLAEGWRVVAVNQRWND